MTYPTIRQILLATKTIAIVGLSAKPHRPSFIAAKYLLDHGYSVIAVNPNHTEILGQKCYPQLSAIPAAVDVVNLFQRAELTPDYARAGVEMGAKVIWLQLDIINAETKAIAEAGGLAYVDNKCMKIEHERIFNTKSPAPADDSD